MTNPAQGNKGVHSKRPHIFRRHNSQHRTKHHCRHHEPMVSYGCHCHDAADSCHATLLFGALLRSLGFPDHDASLEMSTEHFQMLHTTGHHVDGHG